ncbi:MAG: hypothetical protein NVSMB20_22860 [Bradyrhizobium sp.]
MRTDKEAALRGFGRPLSEGLRIEAQCFNRLLAGSEIADGVRRFVERDHPDRAPGGDSVTPGLVRSRKQS